MKVIKFAAPWCGPCTIYKKHWQKYIVKNDDPSLEFVEINVDSDGELAMKYKEIVTIKSIPLTVIMNDDDEVIRSEVGVLMDPKLKDLIYK